MILTDQNDILIQNDWLGKLSESQENLKSRLIERLKEAGSTPYLEKNETDLLELLDTHFSLIFQSLSSGSAETYLKEIDRRSTARAKDPNFEIRHLVALFLLTRQVFHDVLAKVLSAKEQSSLFEWIDALMDEASLTAAKSFSSAREAMVVKQQSELANMTEIVRDEISTLDRNIAKATNNVNNLKRELQELQAYKDALINKMMAVQRSRVCK